MFSISKAINELTEEVPKLNLLKSEVAKTDDQNLNFAKLETILNQVYKDDQQTIEKVLGMVLDNVDNQIEDYNEEGPPELSGLKIPGYNEEEDEHFENYLSVIEELNDANIASSEEEMELISEVISDLDSVTKDDLPDLVDTFKTFLSSLKIQKDAQNDAANIITIFNLILENKNIKGQILEDFYSGLPINTILDKVKKEVYSLEPLRFQPKSKETLPTTEDAKIYYPKFSYQMLLDIVKLSNSLDQKGFHKDADILDQLLNNIRK